MVLQVSTAAIVVIWKFEKNRDKIALFAWEREVIFFSVIGGFCEFLGLINQDMLQTVLSKSMISFLYVLIHFN